jgi:hypothetical protein
MFSITQSNYYFLTMLVHWGILGHALGRKKNPQYLEVLCRLIYHWYTKQIIQYWYYLTYLTTWIMWWCFIVHSTSLLLSFCFAFFFLIYSWIFFYLVFFSPFFSFLDNWSLYILLFFIWFVFFLNFIIVWDKIFNLIKN